MGNYRFKLSGMIPNSWLYKLKFLGRAKKMQTNSATAPPLQHPEQKDCLLNRSSSYIPSKERNPAATDLADQPLTAKSSSHMRRKDSELCVQPKSSVSVNGGKSFRDDLETASAIKLPPIVTKPQKKQVLVHDTKDLIDKREERRSASGSIRCRTKQRRQNSPRIARRNAATPIRGRRALSESMAVVKTSSNPRGDFMESMMEMIMECRIRERKDLEELRACYLSLNSMEFHEEINKVFEHVCFVLTDIICVKQQLEVP
ncbi:transcription repressor OFP3-like [Curcuma longa]|uniref:transcription repressor OFP3-like n=1 Tax=Curcuma longa TaxID=136217 RepID=UPI003D9EA927